MDASGPNSPQVTEIKRDKIHSWTGVDGGAAGTLSGSLCENLLEIWGFSLLRPSLPARLPIHLQRSILRDLLPNPALHFGLYPECAPTDADRAREAASFDLSVDEGGAMPVIWRTQSSDGSSPSFSAAPMR